MLVSVQVLVIALGRDNGQQNSEPESAWGKSLVLLGLGRTIKNGMGKRSTAAAREAATVAAQVTLPRVLNVER